MSKISTYSNEIISFTVMLLMLVAIIAGQVDAEAYQLASMGAADASPAEISHFRLEDE